MSYIYSLQGQKGGSIASTLTFMAFEPQVRSIIDCIYFKGISNNKLRNSRINSYFFFLLDNTFLMSRTEPEVILSKNSDNFRKILNLSRI
jgi:uncharacterized protein with PQ loop repeat